MLEGLDWSFDPVGRLPGLASVRQIRSGWRFDLRSMNAKRLPALFVFLSGVLFGAALLGLFVLGAGAAFFLFPVPLLLFLGWRLDETSGRRRAQEADALRFAGAAEERERILRNLHDDLGAQLLSLVYQADDAQTQERARRALNTLRANVAQTLDQQLTLIEVIESMRGETEHRLQAHGLAVRWDIPVEVDTAAVPTVNVAGVHRVLSEAISNIIRHAHASSVEISVRRSADRVSVALIDDGVGGADPMKPGRGLKSMQERAAQMGGAVVIETVTGGGTRIELSLPS